MLISSPRHTAEDLAAWKEYEIADQARSNSRMLWRNYRRCQEFAREFISGGPAYCSVSWGKDSIVLADMIYQLNPSIPLRWIRVEPIKNPDCELVRDRFLKDRPKADYDEVEVWCSRDETGWHATGTLENGISKLKDQFGERAFLGIRSEESGMRELRTLTHGINTKTSSAPLSYLTATDIFAILKSKDLPVHPAYGCLGGGRWERKHLRVASLGGQRGKGHGRGEWESEYYGEELRRLDSAK